MGWLDLIPCLRSRERRDSHSQNESQVLVAPKRERAQSVASQDAYGTMSMTVGGLPAAAGLSDQQRQRMAEISRVAGNHMRPIGQYVAGRRITSFPHDDARREHDHDRSSSSSASPASSPSTSRNSSPSPLRPLSSPPDGVIRAVPHPARSRSTSTSNSNSNSTSSPSPAPGVVHKSIFDVGSMPASRRSSGSRRPSKRLSRRPSPT